MKLKFLCTQYRDGYEPKSISINIKNADPKSNLKNILENTGYMCEIIAFPYYYKNCDSESGRISGFPYIIKDGILYWNVEIAEITVEDFIITHNITEEDLIYVDTYDEIYGFGSDELSEIIKLWEQIYPYLDQIVTLCAIFGGGKGFILAIKKAFGRKSKYHEELDLPYPNTVFVGICSKKRWTVDELSIAINMPTEQARYLLKAIGYKWSNTDHAYIISNEDQNNFISNINKIIHKR